MNQVQRKTLLKNNNTLAFGARSASAPLIYTKSIYATPEVSNQITLTADLSSDLISPNTADEDIPRVEAMIWFSLQ